ncbi:MAG: DUF2764 domain-containing protein [Candidatus Magnetoovum sp. WYHC-5]|nr:DUF2764 domain-containing protein [Candidatus Magnetoovum sp. WYHC-5]
MMNCYFIVSALPTVDWFTGAPLTLSKLLSEFSLELEPFKKNVNTLILRNKLIDIADNYTKLFDMEDIPEFLTIYFNNNKTPLDRQNNMEALYVAYYEYLSQSRCKFIARYGQFECTLRSVLAAIRAKRAGLSLEKHTSTCKELKELILQNQTLTDFGLKDVFNEIYQVLEAFDKDIWHRERAIDKIRYDYVSDTYPGNPFTDDTIYAYIVRLSIVERWQTLNKEQGKQYIHSLINEEKPE